MDIAPADDLTSQKQRVQDLVASYPLPPIVSGFEVEVADTREGDPAVWVYLHVPRGRTSADFTAQNALDLMLDLSSEVGRVFPGRLPSVQLVTAAQA